MSSKTTGWNELQLAEDLAVELPQTFGYNFIPPEGLEAKRTSHKEPPFSTVALP